MPTDGQSRLGGRIGRARVVGSSVKNPRPSSAVNLVRRDMKNRKFWALPELAPMGEGSLEQDIGADKLVLMNSAGPSIDRST